VTTGIAEVLKRIEESGYRPNVDYGDYMESNVVTLGRMQMEAHDDRLLIIEDPFVSGLECTDCGRTGKIACPDCGGKGKRIVDIDPKKMISLEDDVVKREGNVVTKKCSGCDGLGKIGCPTCKGHGAILFVPDESKMRPTTGLVVSTGDKAAKIKRGDSVCYSSFTGQKWQFDVSDKDGNSVEVVIRCMHDNEVLCKLSGHLEMRRVRKSINEGSAL
jgi:co-chaperonin GroES (HSP10)